MTVGDRLPVELDVNCPSAPPRSNGELVFDEPWESRVFGVTLALREEGMFSWDEFKDELIAAIGRWESDHPDFAGYSYYDCWLEALQELLARHQIVAVADLAERTRLLRARPEGHDHEPPHRPDEPGR